MEVFVVYHGLPIKKGHFSTLTLAKTLTLRLLVTLNCLDFVFIFVISGVNRNMCLLLWKLGSVSIKMLNYIHRNDYFVFWDFRK